MLAGWLKRNYSRWLRCRAFSPQTCDEYSWLDCVEIDECVNQVINNVLNNIHEVRMSHKLRLRLVTVHYMCVCVQNVE